MKSRTPMTPDTDPLARTTALAGALALAALATSAVAGGWLGWERIPAPYAWQDVAVVYFLCAMPLGVLLAALSRRRMPTAYSLTLAVLLMGFCAAIIAAFQVDGGFAGAILRPGLALGITFSSLSALSALMTASCRSSLEHESSFRARGPIVAGALILMVVPSLYVLARCQSDATRLKSLLEQSRYGEANLLVKGILALDPSAEWEGRSLRFAADVIEGAIRDLELRASVPLPADATSDQWLNRSRDLAVLDRTLEALGTLDQAPPELASLPQTANLRGTIHETRGEFVLSGDWYRRARRAWALQPDSAERSAGIVQAVTGIAYSERKLGRYREAEAAYRELLAISPTAETHFLLAQFYEDTQQTTQAQFHAEAAMKLAPERYSSQGKAIIDGLITRHFGCFSVFAAERRSSPGVWQQATLPKNRRKFAESWQ